MEIVMKRLQDLHPYENNPRKNDAAVEYVANSIKEFGFKVPIIADKDGVIVCGHTRYKAAKKLKLDEVPVIYADDLTDEQIKAFRLADNKVGEFSAWDDDLLLKELESLTDLDMSDFGFGALDDLTPLDNLEEPDDDFEVPKEARAKEGDLYKLGDHRLMCGDSSSAEDFRILLGGAWRTWYSPIHHMASQSVQRMLFLIRFSGEEDAQRILRAIR